MERKKLKRIAVTIALIGAFFMFGAGIKKVEAANIDDAAFNAIIAGFYQGAGEQSCALAFYYTNYSYFYDAYVYFDTARTAAYNSALYASYSSAYYAYNAYIAAFEAYDYLDAATYYAYDFWNYGTNGSGDLSFYYGGLAAQSLAYAQYYAAYLY